MPGSREVRAGRAVVELSTDNSPLVKGLKRARAVMAGWSASLKSIGTTLTTPLAVVGTVAGAGLAIASEKLAEVGDRADKAAGRMGISVEKMTALDHAAKLSGTNLETLEVGLATMGKNAVEAARGNGQLAAEFARLGVNVLEFIKLSPDEQLKVMADRLQGIENPTLKAATAMKILGESGRKLLPMLAGGAAGIDKMTQEAAALGIELSGDDTKAAAAFLDSLTKLRAATVAMAFTAAATLFPALQSVTDQLGRGVGAVVKWIKENRGAIITGAALAAGAVVLAGALFAVGSAALVMGTLVGAAASVLTALSTPAGLIAAGLLIYPIYAAAAGAAMIHFSGNTQNALKLVGSAWKLLTKNVSTAWGGIVAAIQAGDLSAAFAVGSAFIQLEWVRLTSFLTEKWNDFKEIFGTFWIFATNTLAKVFTDAVADLEITWVYWTTEIANAWSSMAGQMGHVFNNMMEGVFGTLGQFAELLSGVTGALDLATPIKGLQGKLRSEANKLQGSADDAITQRSESRDTRLQQIESNRQQSQANLDEMAQIDRLRLIAKSDQIGGRRNTALEEAQKKLTEAVDRARKAQRSDVQTRIAEKVDTAQGGLQVAQEYKGFDAVDVRTAEGLSAIIAGIQGTGIQDQLAANTAATAQAAQATATNTAGSMDYLRKLFEDSENTISIGGTP